MVDDFIVAQIDTVHTDDCQCRHHQEPEKHPQRKEPELLLDRQVNKSDQT